MARVIQRLHGGGGSPASQIKWTLAIQTPYPRFNKEAVYACGYCVAEVVLLLGYLVSKYLKIGLIKF